MRKLVLCSVFVMALLVMVTSGLHAGNGKKGLMARVGFDLAKLYQEYGAHVRQQGSDVGFKPTNPLLPVIGNRVVIDAVAHRKAEVGNLKSDLKRLGLQRASASARMVSGQLPIRAIKSMASLVRLKHARPAYAIMNVGDVTSQGDIAMGSDSARANFGVDGTGVSVGVLSDSFDCLNGFAADVDSGDLPQGIVVLAEDPGCSSGTDEGRAIMQLVHDVAPGASLAFHTAFNGQADFASGIQELANLGSDVIVDDVIYLAEPMFQDGIIAQAIDSVVADGVAYFSSAGNNGRKGYEDYFSPEGYLPPGFISLPGAPPFYGGVLHDFGGGNVTQAINIPAGATMILSFQWDDPFYSVCGHPSPGEGCSGADTDMDIYLLDESGFFILAGGVDANIGGDPVEILGVINNGTADVTVNLIIVQYEGPEPGLMKYVRFGGGQATENEGDGTIYGHANATSAEAVGAAFYKKTPAFGQNPPLLESFSSAGPTPILFDASGRSIGPVERPKPEIVGPDGTNTTFFGSDIEEDEDDYPNFFGTSAAAPHAAGVAALMLDREPSSSPANIYTALEETAFDMNTIGFDYDSGYGLVQAYLAVAEMGTSTENRPPTVGIDSPLDGASFDSGNGITFSGWADDPEDGDLTAGLVWTSSIDGQIGTGGDFVTRGKNKLSDGIHTITATMTDSYGASGGDQIRINVGNEPPSVTITSPADGATFQTGGSVEFVGTATDVEDGDLSSGLVWISNVDGQIGTGPSFTRVLNEGSHIIKAEVIDSGGVSGSDSISITVGEPSPEPEMVSAIDMSTKMAGPNVNAIATVTIQEANDNNPVDGATVSGTWTGLTNDHDSGITDASGKVLLSSDKVRNMEGTFTFTIENVVKDGYVYYGANETSGSIHTP